MNGYHYTNAQSFSEAFRRAPLSADGSHLLLFTPGDDWAPTCFMIDSRGRWRAVGFEEMRRAGMRRFGVPSAELPLLSQLPCEQMSALEPLLDALAAVGVEPRGWRLMTERRCAADLINDVLLDGCWQRVVNARWARGQMQPLRQVPIAASAAVYAGCSAPAVR